MLLVSTFCIQLSAPVTGMVRESPDEGRWGGGGGRAGGRPKGSHVQVLARPNAQERRGQNAQKCSHASADALA